MGRKRKKKKRILIVDEQPLFREGLKIIIDRDTSFEVAGEAGNAQDGLKATEKTKPGLVAVGLSSPHQNCIELTREIRDHVPEPKVMIISMH